MRIIGADDEAAGSFADRDVVYDPINFRERDAGRHDAPDRAEAADRVYRTVARRDSKAAPASERKGVTVLSGCSGQGNAAVWDSELSE